MGSSCSCSPKVSDFFYDSSSSDDNGKEFKIHFYEKTNISLNEKENILETELHRTRSKIRKTENTAKVSKHKKKKSSDIHPAINHKTRKNRKRHHKNTEIPVYHSPSNSPTSSTNIKLNMKMIDQNLQQIFEDSPTFFTPNLPPAFPKTENTNYTKNTNYSNRSSMSSLNIGKLSPIMSSSDTDLHVHVPRISADMESKAWDLFNQNPKVMFSPTNVSTISTNSSIISNICGNSIINNDLTLNTAMPHQHQSFHFHRKTKSCSLRIVVDNNDHLKRSLTTDNHYVKSRKVGFTELDLDDYSSFSESESSDNDTNNARVEEWKRDKSPCPGLCESKSYRTFLKRSSSSKDVHSSDFPLDIDLQRNLTDERVEKNDSREMKECLFVNEESGMEVDKNALEMKKQLDFCELQNCSSVGSVDVGSFDSAMAVQRNDY